MAKAKADKKETQVNFDHFNELMGEDSGFEDLNMDTMAIPFVRIMQKLSPQLDKRSADFDPELDEGDIVNTITGRVYEKPLRFVVGKFERYYIEWKPNRGGYVDAHAAELIEKMQFSGELFRNDLGKLVSRATGNEYQDTYVYYVLFPDYLEDGVCVFSFTSTQLKQAKKLNMNLTRTVIPGKTTKALPYFMVWNLETTEESNDKGSWEGINITFNQFVTPDLLTHVVEERKELPNKSLDLALLEAPESANTSGGTDPGKANF